MQHQIFSTIRHIQTQFLVFKFVSECCGFWRSNVSLLNHIEPSGATFRHLPQHGGKIPNEVLHSCYSQLALTLVVISKYFDGLGKGKLGLTMLTCANILKYWLRSRLFLMLFNKKLIDLFLTFFWPKNRFFGFFSKMQIKRSKKEFKKFTWVFLKEDKKMIEKNYWN